MRILFESGRHGCKLYRDNEFRVCMSMNKPISAVWDVTKGISDRYLISLSRNSNYF